MRVIVIRINISSLRVKIMNSAMLKKIEEKKGLMAAFRKTLPIPVEVYESRLNTCKSCEHAYKPTLTCKKCGCFMKIKAKMPEMNCPIGKW